VKKSSSYLEKRREKTINDMTEQEIEKRVELAVENFMAGYGCCQSVVSAFADLYGLDET
jgi:hypothetical protein